jgi:hypothetical protein
MTNNSNSILLDNEKIINTPKWEMTVNGCKVTLNFLSESNGKSVDTAMKILIPSHYQDIPFMAE